MGECFSELFHGRAQRAEGRDSERVPQGFSVGGKRSGLDLKIEVWLEPFSLLDRKPRPLQHNLGFSVEGSGGEQRLKGLGAWGARVRGLKLFRKTMA